MKISEIIEYDKTVPTDHKKLELNGSILTFYHRTYTEKYANSIINSGFVPAPNRGNKVFGTYRLISTLGLDGKTGGDYGDYIVKCYINLTNLKIATNDVDVISRAPSKFIIKIKNTCQAENGEFDILLDASSGGDGYMIVVFNDAIKKIAFDKEISIDKF